MARGNRAGEGAFQAPGIVVAVSAPLHWTMVESALSATVHIVVRSDCAGLARDVTAVNAVMCVLEADGQQLDDKCLAIRRVRSAKPGAGIVLLCTTSRGAGNRIAKLFRAGATETLFPESADFAVELRRLLALYTPSSDRMAVFRFAGLGRIGAAMVDLAASEGAPPRTVRDAATRLGLSRRTLYERISAEGLPTPKRLINLVLLMRLAVRMQSGAMTFERAAFAAGYESLATARRHVQQLTGRPVAELRAPGAIDAMSRRVRRFLTGP